MSTTDKDGKIHIEDEDAMGGETSGRVRYILGFSLLGALVLLSIIWISGALSQGPDESKGTLTERITTQDEMQTEGSDTDAVLLEESDMAGDLDSSQ